MNELKEIYSTKELGEWYDNKYEEMQGTWYTPEEDCEKHIERIRSVNNSNNLNLLDIGCGGGHFLEVAAKYFLTAGIEISDIALEEANIRAIESNLFKEDIEKTTFNNETFDIITSIGTLEHVVNLKDAIIEIHRILSKDGIFYLYAPNEEWTHDDQPNERRMNAEDWKKYTSDYFEIIDFEKKGNNNIYIFKKL